MCKFFLRYLRHIHDIIFFFKFVLGLLVNLIVISVFLYSMFQWTPGRLTTTLWKLMGIKNKGYESSCGKIARLKSKVHTRQVKSISWGKMHL